MGSIVDVPYSAEAEQATLLSCFLSDESLYRILEVCDEDDFHDGTYKESFSCIRTLANKGKHIDRTTVSNILSQEHKETFNSLFDMTGVSVSHIDEYLEILSENRRLRKALEASYSIQQEIIASKSKADHIIEKAEDILFQAYQKQQDTTFKTPEEILDSIYGSIHSKIGNDPNTVLGLTTGISKLNNLSHGLEDGNLILLAGRPSMGKTELALQIAVENTINGVPVAVFSLEQGEDELMERVIAYVTQIQLTKIKKGYIGESENQSLERHYPTIKNLPLHIDDTPNLALSTLVAKAKRLKQRIPELGLIIVDYLQLMDIPYSSRREQEVTQVSKGLKTLARALDIPVMALSQLSRKCEEREDKRPILSDLRESGSLEQDADKVIFMYSDYPYLKKAEKNDVEKYKAEIIVAKHRNGPVGYVDATNHKLIQKFYDREDLKPEHVGYQGIAESSDEESDDLPF